MIVTCHVPNCSISTAPIEHAHVCSWICHHDTIMSTLIRNIVKRVYDINFHAAYPKHRPNCQTMHLLRSLSHDSQRSYRELVR
jgi:hypothetical protein